MAGFWEKKENTVNTELSKKAGPQLLQEAVRSHKAGKTEEAELLYMKTIESGFHHEIAFSNLGVIYKNTNRLKEALEIYKRAILSNPQFADAHANLGRLHKDLGELDQALAYTLRALDLKPDNPDALINLGLIYKDLGQLDQALASTMKSLELKPDNNILALNNLTNFLQIVKSKNPKETSTPIEKVNHKLKRLKVPGSLNSRIEVSAISGFIKQALEIEKDLDEKVFTELSQVYCRSGTCKKEMDCTSYMTFFNTYNAITSRCHECYKVQVKVESLDELIALHLLFKTLNLSSNNTRKCMVELRAQANGLYKGLIYCTSIEESSKIKNYVNIELKTRTDLMPNISIKRGCTEFSNMYKDYGDIETDGQFHAGRKQPDEWNQLEKKHLKSKHIAMDTPTLHEFNLGELLIIKNWIYYAQRMGDLSAISKYGHFKNQSNEFKKQLISKKQTIVTERSIHH